MEIVFWLPRRRRFCFLPVLVILAFQSRVVADSVVDGDAVATTKVATNVAELSAEGSFRWRQRQKKPRSVSLLRREHSTWGRGTWHPRPSRKAHPVRRHLDSFLETSESSFLEQAPSGTANRSLAPSIRSWKPGDWGVIGNFQGEGVFGEWKTTADDTIIVAPATRSVKFMKECGSSMISVGKLHRTFDTVKGVAYNVIFQASLFKLGFTGNALLLQIGSVIRRFFVTTTAPQAAGNRTFPQIFATYQTRFVADEDTTPITFFPFVGDSCIQIREVFLQVVPSDTDSGDKSTAKGWRSSKKLMRALRRAGCTNRDRESIDAKVWELWRSDEEQALAHMWKVCDRVMAGISTMEDDLVCCGPERNCLPTSCTIVPEVDLEAHVTQELTEWLPLEGQSTKSSSDKDDDTVTSAGLAVDGKNKSCAVAVNTSKHRVPWWSVELGTVFKVTAVNITASNSVSDALGTSPFNIFVGNTRCASDMWISVGATKVIPCRGQGDRIKIMASTEDVTMRLCNVGVLATIKGSDAESGCPLELSHVNFKTRRIMGPDDISKDSFANAGGFDPLDYDPLLEVKPKLYIETLRRYSRPLSVSAEIRPSTTVSNNSGCFALSVFGPEVFLNVSDLASEGYAMVLHNSTEHITNLGQSLPMVHLRLDEKEGDPTSFLPSKAKFFRFSGEWQPTAGRDGSGSLLVRGVKNLPALRMSALNIDAFFSVSFWFRLDDPKDPKVPQTLVMYGERSEGRVEDRQAKDWYCTVLKSVNEVACTISKNVLTPVTCVAYLPVPDRKKWHFFALSRSSSKAVLVVDLFESVKPIVYSDEGKANIDGLVKKELSFGGTNFPFFGSLEEVLIWDQAFPTSFLTRLRKEGLTYEESPGAKLSFHPSSVEPQKMADKLGWYSVRIDARGDGMVRYYLENNLIREVRHLEFSHGPVRIVSQCSDANFVRNIRLSSDNSCATTTRKCDNSLKMKAGEEIWNGTGNPHAGLMQRGQHLTSIAHFTRPVTFFADVRATDRTSCFSAHVFGIDIYTLQIAYGVVLVDGQTFPGPKRMKGWQNVRIDVLLDGKVHFSFNGKKIKIIKDVRFTSGPIAFTAGCQPGSSSSPSATMGEGTSSSPNATMGGGGMRTNSSPNATMGEGTSSSPNPKMGEGGMQFRNAFVNIQPECYTEHKYYDRITVNSHFSPLVSAQSATGDKPDIG